MDAYPIYQRQRGKVAAAGYLRDKQGIKPGALSRLYNAIASLNASEVQSKERIRNILDMVYATKTGKELMEGAAGGRISIAFDPDFIPHYATIKNNVIMVSPQDSDDYLANIVVHELHHARQDRALKAAFGSERYFYENANAFADTAYPMIIAEGDAYAGQTINAYEMHLQGIPGPWALQRFSHQYRPLAKALEDQLNRGEDLYSDATRQAIFTAWITNGYLRGGYDTEYLEDMIYMYNPDIDANKSGTTHANEDLIRIADNGDGHSPLQGLDLTQAHYMGEWSRLDRNNAKRLLPMIHGELSLTHLFVNVSEFIELAEDHFSGTHKWEDLPEDSNANAVLSEQGFKNFNRAIREFKKMELDSDITQMLYYAVNIASKYPEVARQVDWLERPSSKKAEAEFRPH